MNHTSNMLHARDLMVSAEPVPYQITVKALQKLLGIRPFSGWLIIEIDDAAVIHFAVSVHPHF